jgi:hypothetical protein
LVSDVFADATHGVAGVMTPFPHRHKGSTPDV